MDYENRTDFRAFDVLVQAIYNASQDELRQALTTATEQAEYMGTRPAKRRIWRGFAGVLENEVELGSLRDICP